LLIDDELPGLAYLKMLCEQLPDVEVVKAFNNPEVFLRELPGLDFDCCILDIQMPGMDGLALANLLQHKYIIFATAYSDYAADAFDLNAVDYLRKPIQKDRLERAVQKVRDRMALKPISKHLQLNTENGKSLIFFEKIMLITSSERDKRDKQIWLEDGEKLLAKNISFDQLLGLLPAADFCRINKGQVIALRCIRFFSQNEITSSILNDKGAPLSFPVGEAYRREFVAKVHL
jgi:DNA-binding LytR/AlgR family response regulator